MTLKGEMDVELVTKLAEYLKANRPANILMPGVIEKDEKGVSCKRPMMAHRDGKWTWKRFEKVDLRKAKLIGILLRDIVVIDIDGREYVALYEEIYPWLQTCPKELTKNGAHYFFLRTKLCDDLRLYDAARAMKSETLPRPAGTDVIPIDIKTLCSTMTGGFLAVTPSENKSWVAGREPWNTAMTDIADEFVRALDTLKGKKERTSKVVSSQGETASTSRRALQCVDAATSSGRIAEYDPQMEQYLRMLSAERWSSRSDWLKIGTALQNEGGPVLYKELFLCLAQEKAPDKFTTREQEGDAWHTFINPDYPGERVTTGTIRAWAKADSPEEYRQLTCRGEAQEEVAFELLEKVVMGLRKWRTEKKEDWEVVARTVYLISVANRYRRQGRELIHSYLGQDEKYDEDEVEEYWSGLNPSSSGKRMNGLIELLREDNPARYGEIFDRPRTDYEYVKEEFEVNHFKIMDPLSYGTFNNGKNTLRRRQDMIAAFENKLVKQDDKMVPFVPVWMKDPGIRTYDRVDFLPPPLECPADVYNTFTGLRGEKLLQTYTAEEIAGVDLGPILNHVAILTNHDPASSDYFLKWLAQQVQQPGRIIGITVLLVSPQGTGKNMFIAFFGQAVLGKQYFVTTEDIEDICGKHGQDMANHLLLHFEEASGKDCFAAANKLKSRITAETIRCEPKGVDKMEVTNACRLILSSNNNTPVKIELEDRRYVCFKCSTDQIGNTSYFNSLGQWMTKDVNAAAFFRYLAEMDICQVDWRNDRPKTELYKDLRDVNVPLEALFLHDLVYTPSSGGERGEQNVLSFSGADLLEKFEEFFKKACPGHKFERTANAFSRTIQNFEGVTRNRKVRPTAYIIDDVIMLQGFVKHGYIEAEPDFIDD